MAWAYLVKVFFSKNKVFSKAFATRIPRSSYFTEQENTYCSKLSKLTIVTAVIHAVALRSSSAKPATVMARPLWVLSFVGAPVCSRCSPAEMKIDSINSISRESWLAFFSRFKFEFLCRIWKIILPALASSLCAWLLVALLLGRLWDFFCTVFVDIYKRLCSPDPSRFVAHILNWYSAFGRRWYTKYCLWNMLLSM